MLAVYMDHTGFAPVHGSVYFPGLHCSSSRLLKPALQGCCPNQALHFMHFPGLSCSGSVSQVLHKGTDLVGHAFCALPKSVKLRRPGVWQGHCPQWTVFLNLLPGLSCSVFWVHHKSAISGVLCVSSGELISGCDFPGRCHLSRIPGRVG